MWIKGSYQTKIVKGSLGMEIYNIVIGMELAESQIKTAIRQKGN